QSFDDACELRGSGRATMAALVAFLCGLVRCLTPASRPPLGPHCWTSECASRQASSSSTSYTTSRAESLRAFGKSARAARRQKVESPQSKISRAAAFGRMDLRLVIAEGFDCTVLHP